MPPDGTLVTEADFARTYDGGAYDDAWTAVQQYRRVAAYRIDHPDAGYTAISNRLEIPLGRVRSWIDYERTPNVVAGLRAARERGWIDITYEDDQIRVRNERAVDLGGPIFTT